MRTLKVLVVLLALASPVFSQTKKIEDRMISFYQEAIKTPPLGICHLYEIYQKLEYLEDYCLGQGSKSSRLEKAGVRPESVKILRLHFARLVIIGFSDRMKNDHPLSNACFRHFDNIGSMIFEILAIHDIGNHLNYVKSANPEVEDSVGLDRDKFQNLYKESVIKNRKGVRFRCEYDIKHSAEYLGRRSWDCIALAYALSLGATPSELEISKEMADKVSAINLGNIFK